MNKIFRIVWNEAAQAWVAVSELTKKHKKRASVTAVAVALVAGMLSPFAEASSTDSEPGSSEPGVISGYNKPRNNENLIVPPGDEPEASHFNGLGFGLAVVDKDRHKKEPQPNYEDTDDINSSVTISVESDPDGNGTPPKKATSYIYLQEGDGIKIDQDGRLAKFSVNAGDGLKVNNGEGGDGKLVADTVGLTVADGKVTAPEDGNKKKLVNAGDLSSALNKLGWKVSAGGATSTVKSGDEVEFKGEGGVTVTTTTDEHGKHIVTIKAEQPQGGTAGAKGADGKSAYEVWKAIPGNEDKSVTEFIKAIKGEKGEQGERGLQGEKGEQGERGLQGEKGEKGDPGRQVVAGKGITATPNADNTLTIAAKTKTNGGISAQDEGLSIDTDGTTITLKSGKVSAETGTITAGATPSVTTADANKLAKAGEVAKAIEAAKTKVVAGSGIKVTPSGNEYTVSADLPFTKNADKSISVNEEGVIRNVANGRVAKDSKDAVNGSQLHAVEGRLNGNMDKLNHRIDKMGKRADAGTASAIATANLLQSYRPGLSAATAAVGQYRGQSAVAVGYSRLSDNGKYGVKFSLGANTQGNVGAGAGVAYFW